MDVGRRQLLAGFVGDRLHDLAELDLQQARQRETIIALEEERDTALARLAVHANDGLVRPAHVGGIDRQVGHFPLQVALRFLGALRGEPLLDRILMGPRERGEHQFAGVRMARVHRQRRAVFGGADDRADVAEIELRIDALRVQVHRQRHQAHVARSLPIAEQAALHPIRTSHHRELRSRHTGAAIVVRMHGYDDAVAPAQMPMHPLDLVGEDVGRGDLDGRGQIQYDRMPRRRFPDIDDTLADLEREIELGHREGFR